jgi:hypothetical protein
MTPACTGIGPKLIGPDQPAADFRIDGPAWHGCDGVVLLFSMELTCTTAAVAIAEVAAATVANGG